MIFEELKNRNLIHQTTNDEKIKLLLDTDCTIYCGFDPTKSLHIGHLIPLITLKRLRNKIICLIGGATAMVGDPTGRSTERPILSIQELIKNKNDIEIQIKSILPNCEIIDNSE